MSEAVMHQGLVSSESYSFTGEVRWVLDSEPPFAKRLQQKRSGIRYSGDPWVAEHFVEWMDVPTVSESNQ